MSTAVTESTYETIAGDPPRKLWTREECSALEAAGLLDLRHLELVEGELIQKMGKKRFHVECVAVLQYWLAEAFGKVFVNAEAPIDVAPADNATSAPEPDVIVRAPHARRWQTANPGPADLLLVVEVSDTTLRFDLTTKARLYARAGIPEYWVLDIVGRRLIVHRNPAGGAYASVMAYNDQESVAPSSAPQAAFRVADALPPLDA